MGCGGTKETPQNQPVEPVPAAAQQAAPSASTGKGSGKGKGKGKGKGMPKGNWQIQLGGDWKDYDKDEDGILKRAFLVGQENAKFNLRGQHYEYNFRSMMQKNLGTKKERSIRAPPNWKPPSEPLLAPGPMVVVSVPGGGQKTMEIDNPNGGKMTVAVPPFAKPGTKMAVPVPDKGETVETVAKRQQSKGGKVAVGAALFGAAAVGGVVLGEHLSGGAISGWAESSPELAAAGDWATGAAEDAGDWATGAAEDAGDWAEGAAEDVGDWATGAADDVGDWATVAVDDVGDWLGGAADDTGDFIMTLF